MKWLTPDGLAAALAVGGAIAVGLGWRGVVLLLAFFLSGSLLTRWSGGEGGRRNARQVIANGAVAAAAALAAAWPVAAGALAAATADTWATEIGSFAPRPPRLLTTGRPVARGTSGGVTLLGTVGGIAGAGGIAALTWALTPGDLATASHPAFAIAVGLAGVVGMLADSLLGATVQAVFTCPECGRRVERRGSHCHAPVRHTKGLPWLDNDGINLAATLTGAAVVLLWQLSS